MRFIYSKTFAALAFALIFVAILAVMQIKGYVEPVKNIFLHSPRPVVYVVRGATTNVKTFFSTIYHLRKITQDNAALSSKVVQLEQNLSEYQQQKLENETLRSELGFFKNSKLNLTSCSVLAANSFNLSDSIILNCGTNQGVEQGQAVVSKGFLVGKIVYVGKTSSTALLVTSSKFSADAKLSKSGADGVARGSFGSGVILDQLSQNDPLEKGWLVITAGINEKIPKGILIGEVGETLSAQNDLFKKVTLISPINFDNLEFVFVAKQ